MRIDSTKRENIKQYILEKIMQDHDDIPECVSNAFGITKGTYHNYIKELLSQNIIFKEKRGKYRLVNNFHTFDLKRSEGAMNSDTYGYNNCLSQFVDHLPGNVKRIWNYVFCEMYNNVIDHSGSENVHIMIQQNQMYTRVLLYDDGVGIFQKIKDHFSFETLDDAICELFKGKLTTDPKNHSGEGIFFSSKMMDYFLIISSNKLFSCNNFTNGSISELNAEESGLSTFMTGTAVVMTLMNNSLKEPIEIFDQYSSVDEGFFKTSIPLKYIGTSLVSRSQARRVFNRLYQFSSVILDFDGVTDLFQGFAHELFIVYPRSNPNLSMTIINMSENVRKMYDHVIKTEERNKKGGE